MHGFSRAGAKRNMTIVRHTPVVGIERDSHGISWYLQQMTVSTGRLK